MNFFARWLLLLILIVLWISALFVYQAKGSLAALLATLGIASIGAVIIVWQYRQYLARSVEQLQSAISKTTQSEEHLSALVAAAVDAIIEMDETGRILLANESAHRMFGWPAGELVGRAVEELMRSEDRPRHKAGLQRYMETGDSKLIGKVTEVFGCRKDGTLITCDYSLAVLKGPDGATRFIGIMRDITDRKKTEQSLRLQTAALEAAANGIVITDSKGAIVWTNPAFTALTRYGAEEVLGQNPRLLKSGKQAPSFYADLWNTISSGRVWYGELVKRRKDDTLYTEEMTITPVCDAVGTIGNYIAIKQDITERKRAEENLRETNAALEALIHASPVGIVVLDRAGNVKMWNPTSERMFGWREEEILGRPLPTIPPDKLEEHRALRERVLHDKAVTGVELRRRKKDGALIDISLSAAPLHDAQGNIVGILGMMADISERKNLADQLRQSQKMEAVGQLTGGIAHDFNNMLTVINGYSELLLQTLPATDPQRDNAVQIREAGERAAALTRQLLAFSRRQMLAPAVLDINASVTNMDRLLHRVIGEDIALVSTLKPGLGRVKADPGQIEQVIMNLAVNARDAMPKGGKLTIETADVELDEDYARQHLGSKPGPHVMLAVSDTGAGMDAKTQARIFEPFFTTKEQGKGTGLGLATVYGIVKQSGGSIWVYSEPGRGTTFKVYLPRVEEAVKTREPRLDDAEKLQGTETVLLAEDNRPLREFVRTVLQKNGYTVLAAGDSGEAARMLAQPQPPIHLLVTDVVMPDMSGRELSERLAGTRLGTKVLYMSGYTDDAVVRHGVLEEGTAFLQKPFTPVALLTKVREVLDRREKEPA